MEIIDDFNRVTVRINAEEHILRVSKDKSPEYVKQIAQNIDKQMSAIKQKNPRLSSTQVAITVAMHLADQLHNLKDECNQLYQILMEYEREQSEGKK